MQATTHQRINERLSGTPTHLGPGVARVELETLDEMLADRSGLIHGGFIFSLADYAAMLAVNHPNVVLGAAEVRFMKPVVLGDRLVAEGRAGEPEGVKVPVAVEVRRRDEVVFIGTFTCFTPERHVLEPS